VLFVVYKLQQSLPSHFSIDLKILKILNVFPLFFV
jgi:hypothetical protein